MAGALPTVSALQPPAPGSLPAGPAPAAPPAVRSGPPAPLLLASTLRWPSQLAPAPSTSCTDTLSGKRLGAPRSRADPGTPRLAHPTSVHPAV